MGDVIGIRKPTCIKQGGTKFFVRLYVEKFIVEIKILIFEYQETLIKSKVLEISFFVIVRLLGVVGCITVHVPKL